MISQKEAAYCWKSELQSFGKYEQFVIMYAAALFLA